MTSVFAENVTKNPKKKTHRKKRVNPRWQRYDNAIRKIAIRTQLLPKTFGIRKTIMAMIFISMVILLTFSVSLFGSYQNPKFFSDNTAKSVFGFGLFSIFACIFSWINDYLTNYDLGENELKLLPEMSPQDKVNHTLRLVRDHLDDVVKDSFEAACAKKNIDSHDVTSRRKVLFERAVEHVQAGSRFEDVIAKCHLEVVNNDFLSNLFRIHGHFIYHLFIHTVVLCHIALAFFESKTARTNFSRKIGSATWAIGVDPKPLQSILESVCLLIELTDVIIRILWMYKNPRNILRPRSETFFTYFYLFIVLFLGVDLFINWYLKISLEFIIPLRALLVIVINETLRREIFVLFRSLGSLLSVLKMYVIVLLFSSIMAIILFGDVAHNEKIHAGLNLGKDLQDEFLENSNQFTTIYKSFSTMFVFLSSAENYTTVVYPAIVSRGRSVLLFFVPMMFIGLYTLMALVTSIFEDVYSIREQQSRRKQQWWERTGIIAAFILLDRDCSDSLNEKEFFEFVSHFRSSPDAKKLSRLFRKLDEDGSGVIYLKEFIEGIEVLRLSRFLDDEENEQAVSVLSTIMTSSIYRNARHMFFVLQFWCFCWYNIVSDNHLIDNLVFGFLFISLIDLILLIASDSWKKYWSPTRFEENVEAEQFGNRFDLLIMSASIFGTIISWIVSRSFYLTSYRWCLIFPAISLMRVLIHWKTSLNWMFMLREAASTLLSLFTISFCIFFIYAVIGVSLFRNKFRNNDANVLSYMKDDFGGCNFNTLGHAMIALYQGFVGEAYHEIMLATISSHEHKWAVSWYMISYFMVISVLLGNLLFGLLLSIFRSLFDVYVSGRNVTRSDILKAQMLSDDADDDDLTAKPSGAHVTQMGESVSHLQVSDEKLLRIIEDDMGF